MDAPTSANDPSRAWRVLPRQGHLVALVVLLGALALVFAGWHFARERELRVAHTAFVAQTGEVTDLLRERLVQFELVTRGGGSLFASVDGPTAAQWRSYVEGMQVARRFRAMVGLGFAGYVDGGSIAQLQMDWRDAGYGLLDVRPHGARDVYGPILYLEPRTPENVAAIGFDMYSNPARRAAMQAALESGEARLTGPVHLVQDRGSRATGMLLYLPIYRGGGRPASARARREQMQGWVYMPLRVRPLVESALGRVHRSLAFRVYDVTDGEALLHATPRTGEGEPAFRYSRLVHQYGRDWRIDFESAPLDVAAPRLQALQHTLALGLLAALLLYGLTFALARTESRAKAIALRLTEELRGSEARFRVAMVYASTGNALLDAHGRIVEANPALAAILGCDAATLPGRQFESLFMADAVEQAPAAEGPDSVQRATRRLHRDDGTIRHVQLTYAAVPGNPGQDIVCLVQVDDVTERVRAEARVHALNRTLEARVALRTRELSQANQELESFAYSVSHDLRAPLRAIDGFSRILSERYADALDEAGRGYLARVRKAAGRMGELIDAMLHMARLSRGEINVERVDLGRLAADLVDDLRAGEPGRAVAVDIQSGLEAWGDAVLLRNLLDNLLGNAWKFTRGREHPAIEVGRAAPEAGGEFYVRDNGAGFPQAYVDKLFRPFQRLHSEEEFSGHGIGLATVRRIVERHGGTIRAEGREGEGATFYFTLQAEPPG